MKKLLMASLVCFTVLFAGDNISDKNADSAVHLLGKMEANLWESSAAVYFHIADHSRKSQRIALNDYQDDIETMDRVIDKIQNLKLSSQDRVAILNIRNNWLSVKAMSNKLIKVDVVQEFAKSIENSELHQYWLAVEALDHLIDKEIHKIEGEH